MDRSGRLARGEARRDARRDGPREPTSAARPATAPPASSRLNLRRTRNRRRQGSMWSRLPRPAAIADACGRALRRSLPAVAALAALAVLGGGLCAGYRWLTHSPRFAIAEIAVRGAHRVDPDALRARLPIRVGDNAFADLTQVARAVRGEPWVAAADVRRVLPHTIVIELREHVAAAAVELGELYLVDPDGRPFKRAVSTADAGEADGLPIITGLSRAGFAADPAGAAASVRAALAAIERWRSAERPAIGEVHIDPHGAIALHTRDPEIAIELGAPGDDASATGARIRAFDTAWAALSDAERARARAIHLDVSPGIPPGNRPDHVTVAFAKDQ
jgi:cell division protein FtsQ